MEVRSLVGFVVITNLALSSVLGGRAALHQRTTCSLYIRTDPTLWRHVRQNIPNNQDPGYISEVNQKTHYEIRDIVSNHVSALNYMFASTKFDGRLEHRNIKFQIQKLEIDRVDDCNPNAFDRSPFCDESVNASALLNTFATQNSEDFCLAYLFTYRDFHDYRLGKVFVAQLDSTAGGICTKYKTYTSMSSLGNYESNKFSLNTGIITLLNNGKQLPERISQYNFARYVGISFGAQYENDIRQCDETEQDCKDAYKMTRILQSDDSEHMRYFSAPAIEKISSVLDAISSGIKRNCFCSSTASFCGNKIVEDGEECDCGFDDHDCTDHCCYPRLVSMYDRERNDTAKGCSRRALTQCSPSQGPCCHEGSCQLIPSHTNTVCKEVNNQQLFCSGLSAKCPEANL